MNCQAEKMMHSSPPESGGETREARRGGSFTIILKVTVAEPPRLRLQRWLRGLFLVAQPPLLTQEGSFVHARMVREFIHTFQSRRLYLSINLSKSIKQERRDRTWK